MNDKLNKEIKEKVPNIKNFKSLFFFSHKEEPINNITSKYKTDLGEK